MGEKENSPNRKTSARCRDEVSLQAELEASRLRYMDLYDRAPVGYCTLNEDGLILEANRAADDLLGVPHGSLIQQSISRFILKEDHEINALHRKQLFETGRQHACELRMVKPEGTVFWVQMEASVAKNLDGEPVCRVVLENIDDRKRGEIQQRLLVEILQILNEPLSMDVSTPRILGLIQRELGFDTAGIRLKKTGRFPWFVQQGFSECFLLSENSLVACGADCSECPAKDGNGCPQRVCNQVLSGQTDSDKPFFTPKGSFWTNELAVLHGSPSGAKPGSCNCCIHDGCGSVALIPVRMHQKNAGLLQLNAKTPGILTPAVIRFLESLGESIGVALTKYEVEGELRESKEMFDLFMAHSPIFSFIKEVTPDGSRVLHASDNFKKMTGFAGSDMIGKTMAELFPPELAAKITADDQDVVSGGEILEVEESLNGRSYFTIKFPIVQGDRTLLAGYTIDITGRKQAEEDHKKVEDKLRQLQKMEAVERLAGGVAHDFNNMLQIILGDTELLLASEKADAAKISLLEAIADAGRRAAGLTRQLLSFARKDKVVLQVLNINQVIGDMMTSLRQLAGERIEILWTPPDNPYYVRMDRSQLHQILTGLIGNARDAIAGDGRIMIETEEKEVDEAYSPGRPGFMPSPYVLLTVSDTGCGIDREMLDCIFEPFFTTKPEYLGCGLGLASLYGIVRQSKGFVEVDSQVGQGTTFRIYLPRQTPVEANRPQPVTHDDSSSGTQTILLVEDEASLLALLKNQLMHLGYNVLAFADPVEALDKARSYSGDIHLLLTDVSMQKMQGSELSARVTAMRPQIKCIFMSGYTSDILLCQQDLREDNLNFLQKPFSVAGLAQKIKDVLAL